MKAINVPWKRSILSQLVKPVRHSSNQTSEYVQRAIYPEILDLSDAAVKRRDREVLFDKYRKLKTVEEKLFAINLPKYYGWKSLILKEGSYPYGLLPFVKHITRTKHYNGSLELFYKVLNMNRDETREVLDKIRPAIQRALLFELKGRRWQNDGKSVSDCELQNIVAKSIIRQINNIIISHLSPENAYLFDSVSDFDARVESFWAVGEFFPSEAEILDRVEKKKDITEEEKNDTVEHFIQYLGSPSLQVRVNKPLRVLDTAALEIANLVPEQVGDKVENNSPSITSDVEPFNFDPYDSFGLSFERRFGTNLPGFWAGDENEFGLLSYHLCGHLLDRPPHFGPDDALDTITSQAILASFSWLHAQATYQGFSTFEELTYPLVNQSVVTDGHHFSTHLYQLNTTLLHSDNTITNPRKNIAVSLPHQPLYQDIKDNQFVGWNDEVLESLVLLYLNKPEMRQSTKMKPYLDESEVYLSNISDDEKERRVWLHRQFHHMYSNRPRHRLPYEIYDWERIYKIKFNMRPMDARLRPFELDANPLEDRKYYQHAHEYIPKAQRGKKNHWTGWRNYLAETYYPDIE